MLLLKAVECRAQFPESIVSLSGSLTSSYDHQTVFTLFPESIVATVVKMLVANESSRGTRSALRGSLTLHKTSNTTECPAGDAKVTIGYIA